MTTLKHIETAARKAAERTPLLKVKSGTNGVTITLKLTGLHTVRATMAPGRPLRIETVGQVNGRQRRAVSHFKTGYDFLRLYPSWLDTDWAGNPFTPEVLGAYRIFGSVALDFCNGRMTD